MTSDAVPAGPCPLLGFLHDPWLSLHESIRYFEKLSEGGEKSMKSEALFNLAWLHEATGAREKSKASYEQLLDQFPDSIYGDLVKEKINS